MSTGVISLLSLIYFRALGDNILHLEDTTIEGTLKTFQEHYLGQDYSNALVALKNGESTLPRDVWHFNMGTVLAQMKNWPLARYHLIAAKENGLSSKELLENLSLVESTLEISKLEKPLEMEDYLIRGSLYLSDGLLTTLAFIFLLVSVRFLKKKPSFKTVGIVLLSVLAPLALDFWIGSWRRSIVLESVTLFDAPSSIFGTKGEIPAGVMVISDEKEGWEKIIYPSRFSGWIKARSLKRLN